MRRLIVSGLIALALSLSVSTGAFAENKGKTHDGVCPAMALEHAKDLGLSTKQTAELKKIKQSVMQTLEKASSDTKKVLTADQVAKYNDLAGSKCPACRKCGKCGDKHKGKCSAKDGGKCDVKKKDKECCKKDGKK